MNFSHLFLIVWIASGHLRVEGVNQGMLGQGDSSAVEAARACARMAALEKRGLEPHLYRVGQGSTSICDWGCESPVNAEEVRCVIHKTDPIPAQEETRIEPLNVAPINLLGPTYGIITSTHTIDMVK